MSFGYKYVNKVFYNPGFNPCVKEFLVTKHFLMLVYQKRSEF